MDPSIVSVGRAGKLEVIIFRRIDPVFPSLIPSHPVSFQVVNCPRGFFS
jgi:hypothetical protein